MKKKYYKKKKFNPLQVQKIVYFPIILLLIVVGLTIAFLLIPNYIECNGQLVPEMYYPTICKNSGIVISNQVNDGRFVQEALEKLMRGRTTITIAHRLSTIINADCIFVVDNGVIAERGTHTELLSIGGRYYELYSKMGYIGE